MPTPRRKLVAGNWKMNGLTAALAEIEALARDLGAAPAAAEIVVAPPATLLAAARAPAGTSVALAGQDCHAETAGAFTGDVSAEMLKDAGAAFVILGHSERRTLHGETDAMVQAKVQAAFRAGIVPIVCIGETLGDREDGHTLAILGGQVAESLPDTFDPARIVIAYEPVWAIGTGLTPTSAEIAAAHGFIREKLKTHVGDAADSIRILYGGSVKPVNAAEIMSLPDVDGALVGGASLKAADFLRIVRAAG